MGEMSTKMATFGQKFANKMATFDLKFANKMATFTKPWSVQVTAMSVSRVRMIDSRSDFHEIEWVVLVSHDSRHSREDPFGCPRSIYYWAFSPNKQVRVCKGQKKSKNKSTNINPYKFAYDVHCIDQCTAFRQRTSGRGLQTIVSSSQISPKSLAISFEKSFQKA